ncbi:hypothetical protein ACHAW5_005706 [Stephanodiscus triporus]|uniref:Uncharacterized protein n=1 Tax=Stephanodiscus triporus TaxID=2934178 RepID=A0ABD3NKV9_9STRA
MLEGGNGQLDAFFDRRGMGRTGRSTTTRTGCPRGAAGVGAVPDDRYMTKDASFYRQRLMGYARSVARGGTYGGREASRGGSGGGGGGGCGNVERTDEDDVGAPSPSIRMSPAADGKEAVRAE